jgi:hypothetical protein
MKCCDRVSGSEEESAVGLLGGLYPPICPPQNFGDFKREQKCKYKINITVFPQMNQNAITQMLRLTVVICIPFRL